LVLSLYLHGKKPQARPEAPSLESQLV